MIDTSAPTATPADDLFATRHPELSASRGFAWSDKAKPLGGAHGRLRFTLFLFLAVIAFNVIIVGAMMYLFLTFQDPSASVEEPSAMVAMLATIVTFGGTYLPFALIGAYVICILFYSLFVYRAMKNLHLSNARALSVSPAWAVGWSFIPFANLGMIPSVMRQIWTGSHDPSRGNASPPSITVVWWATFIAANVISRISEAMVPSDATLESTPLEGIFDAFLPSSVVTAVACALYVVSTFCLMTIIKQIRDAQDALGTTSAFNE